MHDGYLYSFGIAGTAAGSHPAPALLGALLRAIPPVKRAALLGDVVLLDQPNWRAQDHQLAEYCAEIADAELLLIVSPLRTYGPPPRLRALLQHAADLPPKLRVGLLIELYDGDTPPAHSLQALVKPLVSELEVRQLAEAAIAEPAQHDALMAQFQALYWRARRYSPHALPREASDG